MVPRFRQDLCGCSVGVEVEAIVFTFNLNEEVVGLRGGVKVVHLT